MDKETISMNTLLTIPSLDGQTQTKGTCGLSKKKQVIFRTRKSQVPQNIP
jgi:hypothetical protein